MKKMFHPWHDHHRQVLFTRPAQYVGQRYGVVNFTVYHQGVFRHFGHGEPACGCAHKGKLSDFNT